MFNNLELGVFSEGKHYGDFISLRDDKINDCFIFLNFNLSANYHLTGLFVWTVRFQNRLNVVIYDLDCAVKVIQKLFFRHH